MSALASSSFATAAQLTPPDRIDGVVPGVRGQRAFPTRRLRNADPFLMLDHIGPQHIDPARVISGQLHPHRGFETVSIILAGELDHVDSLGNEVPLRGGDIQIMNAGRGIQHGGDMRPDPHTGLFHEFQLWVNVPATHKMEAPSLHNVAAAEIPTVEREGATVRVLTGAYAGHRSPAQTTAPTTILHVTLLPDAGPFEMDLPPGQRGFIYMIGGQLQVHDQHAAAFETLDFGTEGTTLRAEVRSEGAEFLVLAGRPLNEPVAFGGPFVMNTAAEIEQAFADLRRGGFGAPTAPRDGSSTKARRSDRRSR